MTSGSSLVTRASPRLFSSSLHASCDYTIMYTCTSTILFFFFSFFRLVKWGTPTYSSDESRGRLREFFRVFRSSRLHVLWDAFDEELNSRNFPRRLSNSLRFSKFSRTSQFRPAGEMFSGNS